MVIARFLKTDDSGEVISLPQIKGITLLPCEKSFGFSWNMSDKQRREAGAYYSGLLEKAWKLAAGCDLLILDEIAGACAQGFVEEAHLLKLLEEKPPELEVILTGRTSSESLMACADYITEMVMRRHPYEKGIPAREGIEY